VLALLHLKAETKAHCIPLLDLAAPTKKSDQAAVQSFVERNIHRMVKALKGFERALVDSSELEPNLRIKEDKHPLIEAAIAVTNSGSIPIPVTGLHRDKSHMKAALKIRTSMGDGSICFRFDATDVATASLSYTRLTALLSDNSVDSSEVILLLDLQSVYGEEVEPLAVQVSRFITQFSKSEWAALIVAGYAVPDQISEAIAVREQGYIPRVAQDIFLSVARASSVDNLWFGDYTILSPTHVELDWWVVQKIMTPRIIYALNDSWFVVRGGPFSSHPDGYSQYHNLAAKVMDLDEFSGFNYSFGDKYIQDCATGASSTGNAGSWITACVNHHITLSAEAHHHP